jgi:dTDP-4-amino-4,6-dideoxygalactose transaminase
MLGVHNCISCGNGTDVLYIAMKALGVELGDEVITTAHSWISTSETITQAGARVVFCDTNEDDFFNVSKLSQLITPKTKGIIPVHLYGKSVDMAPLMEIAKAQNLTLLRISAEQEARIQWL